MNYKVIANTLKNNRVVSKNIFYSLIGLLILSMGVISCSKNNGTTSTSSTSNNNTTLVKKYYTTISNYGKGTRTYTYNSLNQISEIKTDYGITESNFKYNNNGNLIYFELRNSVDNSGENIVINYNSNNQLTEIIQRDYKTNSILVRSVIYYKNNIIIDSVYKNNNPYYVLIDSVVNNHILKTSFGHSNNYTLLEYDNKKYPKQKEFGIITPINNVTKKTEYDSNGIIQSVITIDYTYNANDYPILAKYSNGDIETWEYY